MRKKVKNLRERIRLSVQLVFTALTNGYAVGFAKGSIYTGGTKALCVPGLNCYSCPGALGACPLGSLQMALGSRGMTKPLFYIVGILFLFGAFFGRLVCGWLCPFGLVQDLLYRIPFLKKCRVIPFDSVLKYLKYVILAVFVILLPLFAVDITGLGTPWFCKYICPSGTLMAGIPLSILNDGIRGAVGFLYFHKLTVLIILLIASVIIYRPFCRYLCPLGAIYGLFNPISLFAMSIDSEKCTDCGRCKRECPMDIAVTKSPNSPECIRCGRCKTACPEGAIGYAVTAKSKCSSCKAEKSEKMDGKAK